MLDVNKIRKDYETLFSDTKHKTTINILEPQKLMYGTFPYNIKLRTTKYAHQRYVDQITRGLRLRHYYSLICETRAQQDLLIKLIRDLCPKKVKKDFNLIIDIYTPFTAESLKNLEKLSEKTSNSHLITYITGEKFHKKFAAKIVFNRSSSYNDGFEKRENDFLENFGLLFNMFGNEIETEDHRFSTAIVNTYYSVKNKKEKRGSDQILISNAGWRGDILPRSFTLYVKDEATLNFLLPFTSNNIKIHKIELVTE